MEKLKSINIEKKNSAYLCSSLCGKKGQDGYSLVRMELSEGSVISDVQRALADEASSLEALPNF